MNSTSKHLAIFALCLFTLTGCQSEGSKEELATDEPTLPNIILLVGDDQGYPYFGFMGANYVHTPNMDSLAASGTLFTDGYVSDNHCRPSLQTLLNGVLPIDYYRAAGAQRNALVDSLQIPADSLAAFTHNFDIRGLHMANFATLPSMLAEKGYASFQGGKWWEYTFQNGGFTHGMTKGWLESDQKTGNWFLEHMGGQGMDLARVTNQPAYDFLEETKGQPFFMWFAPSLPHYPFDAPQKYYDLYAEEEMTESAKQYYANCTWFDDAWGQLVQHLKDHDLFDNTLIVYVNDNGWEQDPDQEFWDDPMRSHNGGDKGKGSIYDMSFRSPIIFSYPSRIPAQTRTSALIHSADIPATILDYAGISTPEHFHGQSFRPVLEGTTPKLRDRIIGNVITTRSDDPANVMGDHVNGYWIREGNWFLRWHETKGEIELFDLTNDLRNDHDLSAQHPEITEGLMAQLREFKAEKGADWRLEMYGN